MTASRQDIKTWIERGKLRNSSHLLVIHDTYDHENYPVYADGDADALQKFANYNGHNMQRVDEVYDLSGDIDAQLNEYRAMHLPTVNQVEGYYPPDRGMPSAEALREYGIKDISDITIDDSI